MNLQALNLGASGTAARLRFEHIRHGYGGRDVVRDVSLTAFPGRVLCLLGPSGSGKSTLLRIAAGLEVPRGGRLLINDVEVSGPHAFLPPEQRGVGLMFQDFALFPHMTVGANVAFGLTHLSKAGRQAAAGEALARVGLAGYEGKYPHMLSGGEQQRVALARAVAPKPSVLLMDEPFSGLDSRLKDQVRADTLAVLRETGATVVIVTHDPEEAMGMADQIALLKDGELVQTGSARDLFLHPGSVFAASFFSEINRFEAVARNGLVETPFGTRRAPENVTAGEVTLAVRFSDIRVATVEQPGAVPASVIDRRYLGTSEHLTLALEEGGATVEASISAGMLAEGISRVFLFVAEDAILMFEKQP
ncbi:ABC transporter ATP-binding protein [Martelella radicis]|uniref:Iron(III) transport system ATP-binding protein n=1 Tax=Martelella radicis TaxID=1397476 RepID=A0A7W6P992_9HYPH|nr:ABC transporter ATP-binding protein [Martelella radicis]MBB4120177.1 iron(III) transport system ATP-binding protein [Martelella radicis]